MSEQMTLDQFEKSLEAAGYISERDDRIALTAFLATELGKPPWSLGLLVWAKRK